MNNKFLIIAIILASTVVVTVILASFFMGFKTQNSFTITSVYPQSNSQNISLSPQISVSFSRPLIKNEIKSVSIIISPKVDNIISWGNTNDAITAKLKEALYPETGYLVTINYGGHSFSWSFKTQSPTIVPTPTITATPVQTQSNDSQDIPQQGLDDAVFSQSQVDFLNSHPWYDSLPPQNDRYYINFDASNNDFFVELYPVKNSSVSIDNQVDQLKSEVMQELKNLGVNTNSYQIEWITLPK